MEKVIEKEEVKVFIKTDEYPYGYGNGYGSGNGYGYGSGDGYGNGSGDGYGNGYGYGSGYGSGDGYGYGSGYGYGYGSGNGYGYGKNIEYFNHQKIYKIDEVQTLIDNVRGSYAHGRILNDDLTTTPCYIAKMGNFFAHGETLRQAQADAMEKYAESQPLEERIAQFNAKYPDSNVKIPASEFFLWHHILTGSCLMGRQQFCKEHSINIEKDTYTVQEFISITKNAYGSDIINQLKISRTL